MNTRDVTFTLRLLPGESLLATLGDMFGFSIDEGTTLAAVGTTKAGRKPRAGSTSAAPVAEAEGAAAPFVAPVVEASSATTTSDTPAAATTAEPAPPTASAATPPAAETAPPTQAEFFAHCRLLCETNGFGTEGLSKLTTDFGGKKLSEVPVDRWREMMAEGSKRSAVLS